MVPRGTAGLSAAAGDAPRLPAAFTVNPAGARPGSAAPAHPETRLLLPPDPRGSREDAKGSRGVRSGSQSEKAGKPRAESSSSRDVWALSTPRGPAETRRQPPPPRPLPTRSPEDRSLRPRCSPRGSGSCSL